MEARLPVEPSQVAGGRLKTQNNSSNERGTTKKSADCEATKLTRIRLQTEVFTEMDSFPPAEHSKDQPHRFRSSPTTYEYDSDEESAARGFQTGAWDECSVTSNSKSRSNSWIDFTNTGGDGILKDAAPVLPKLTARRRYGLIVFTFGLVAATIAAVVVGTKLMHPSTKSAAAAATPPLMQHGNSSQSPQSPSFSQQQQEWLPLGEAINGKQQQDNFGRTLAISSDGSTFAASTESGRRSNYVQVYRLDSNTDEWVQLGHDFITTDQAYVDLAKNGTVLSIATIGRADESTLGSVQLFAWSSAGGWTQLGNTIVAPQGASSRYFGYETKISEDGSTVVVGDPGEGIATVYQSGADGTWTWIGQPLDAGITGDFYRCAISINYDGTIVAIGTWDNDRQKSLVRVYEQQPEQTWRPRGSDIAALSSENNSNEGKETRLSVSLSSDGNVIAIGDRFFNRLANEGMAQVLHYTDSEWMPVGTPIVGTQTYGRMGTSISLSADGGTVAVGVPMRMPREGVLEAVGMIQVYQQQQQQGWVGKTPATSDDAVAFGSYVALSSDGKTVAVADQYDKSNGVYTGSVTVFRLTNTVA